jgi:hypothetical protein
MHQALMLALICNLLILVPIKCLPHTHMELSQVRLDAAITLQNVVFVVYRLNIATEPTAFLFRVQLADFFLNSPAGVVSKPVHASRATLT